VDYSINEVVAVKYLDRLDGNEPTEGLAMLDTLVLDHLTANVTSLVNYTLCETNETGSGAGGGGHERQLNGTTAGLESIIVFITL